MSNKTLYIETTIPSYATARDSLDLLKLHRQVITRAFWQDERHRFSLCTSQETHDECARGSPNAAARRLAFLEGIEKYPVTENAKTLAVEYRRLLAIPSRASSDCVHLAVCVVNRVDFLMTWNCSHLGPAAYTTALGYNDKRGLWTPKLVTPENIIETIELEEV
jgi:hypothetical protein